MVSQRLAVVFVHGFLSGPAVWSRFISLVEADPQLADVAVHAFEYATPRWSFHLLRRIPNLNDVADSLRTYLRNDLVEPAPVVLVSHSMGGLVVQRMLARTLAEGAGQELARIRRIVMFACPNLGSEVALLLRRLAWFWRQPQERELRPLTEAVAEAQRAVLHQVVHATAAAGHQRLIPIVAYAGETDGVVTPASARGMFPRTGVVAGDHFSIIQPDSPTHRSYTALKRDLLAALAPAELPTPRPDPDVGSKPHPGPSPGPDPSPGRESDPRWDLDRGQALDRLVGQLLAVPRITEPSFREQLYGLLPPVIVHQLARDPTTRQELIALLRSFDRYPQLEPWQALVDALTTLQPQQPAVDEVAATLTALGRTSPPPRR